MLPWIIERLDRKLMSRGLISNRRLAGSCFKMALTGSGLSIIHGVTGLGVLYLERLINGGAYFYGILRYGGKCSPYSGWSHAIRGELRDSELAFSWETGH